LHAGSARGLRLHLLQGKYFFFCNTMEL
jgi:hypothetical protein